MNTAAEYKLAEKVEIPEYNEENKAVLFAYLKGLEEKFSKFSTILEKTNLFHKMLTSKGFVKQVCRNLSSAWLYLNLTMAIL